jgi:nitrite reductase/ring-hydroxylating ferredoxin subunit/uncharacterized membrane protein
MKAFLQGRWLGHPLHPIFVHYPVGLWILSLVLDVITRFTSPNNALVVGSFYAMLGGTGIAALAAVTGLADWSDIRRDHEARRPATLHMIINLAAIGLYIVNLILRYASLDGGRVPLLHIALSLLGIGAISVSGYLGGLIVYDDGVGVGRHRRKTEMPDETVKSAGTGEWVVLGDANSLEDGGTLRAEVAGHVMAVVKSGGEVYAFQEFCTHRFGPLSEGALLDGQIECPWHRSCFDIRTGKVTQGPAKVDLKTYDAEVRDGKIRVRVAS